MERQALASKAVLSVGYDEPTLVLEIEFRSGRVYQYSEVPRGVYEWLLRTPSKGSYVARMINDRYAYRDVTQPVTSGEPDLLAQLRDSLRAPTDKQPG